MAVAQITADDLLESLHRLADNVPSGIANSDLNLLLNAVRTAVLDPSSSETWVVLQAVSAFDRREVPC